MYEAKPDVDPGFINPLCTVTRLTRLPTSLFSWLICKNHSEDRQVPARAYPVDCP